MNEDKREKLKKLLEVVNDGISRQDFANSFKKVINQVVKIETRVLERVDSVIKELQSEQKKLRDEVSSNAQKMESHVKESVDKMFKEQRQNLDFINDKLKKIKSGEDGRTPVKGVDYFDGQDADEEKIAAMVLQKIKVPESNEARIKELEEEVEELKKRPVRGGGGTSAMGVAHTFKYIAHTEEPVGDIDGANTTYTVKNNIWWIAGFTLNGEQIAELPNFTFTGKTITFSTALPAAYDGKDFEVKYIGT